MPISKNRKSTFVYENVIDALEKTKVKPKIHSDNGFEYTSYKYTQLINKYKFIQTMGKPKASLDNRFTEYFFSILKRECINRIHLSKRTPEYVVKTINEYMHWYNDERIINKLKTSPVNYRK